MEGLKLVRWEMFRRKDIMDRFREDQARMAERESIHKALKYAERNSTVQEAD